MSEKKNIPELRFPEFTGEWNIHKINNLVIDTKGAIKIGPFGSQLKKQTFVKKGYKVYGQENIFIDDFSWGERYITPEHYNSLKSNRLIHGDFVVSTMGTIGKCAVIPNNIEEGIMDSHIIRLRLNTDKITHNYLAQLFLAFSIQKQIKRLSVGGIMDGLSIGIINEIKFPITSIPEQQKIASFFIAIDHKISQLKQKKSLLEQYKKGVIQKIFSQESDEGGSRTPIKNKQSREQIRFRDDDGQELPKWEKYKFRQIYSFKTTNSFSREDLNYDSGKVKNIHYGDIHMNLPTLVDISKEEIPYLNPGISISRINEDNYCKTNDLVFADASEDVEDVGKCIELINLNREKVLSGLHTILARPDSSIITSGFGGYLMKSFGIRKQIMKVSQGTKVTSISSSRLGEIDLNIPSPKEQLKIANFLSAIDQKINHTQTQIEKAELWKKGLLQKMFV